MSGTTPQNLRASFPLPSSPLVDLATGNINNQWLDYFIAEYARTGGARGPSADLATVATTAFGAVRRSGDTMTGALILSGAPVVPLQAATKAYVDAGGGSAVTSVAGRIGNVVLTYTDISGLATVAHTGAYADLSGTPAIVSPATVAPLVDGTAAVGTSLLYARQDHVHPTDTSRAPLNLLSVASFNVAGGSNVTLTAAQCQFAGLNFYGVLTANITVTLPVATSAVQIWTVGNQCTGNNPLLDGSGNPILDGSGNVITDGIGCTITLRGVSGGAITLPQGAFQTIRTDGTGIYNANTVASISSGSIEGAPIGESDPAGGAFTTLSVSGPVSGAGFTALLAPYATTGSVAALAPVQSVAGRIGAVVLTYTDISGLATVAHTGAYADLSGAPAIVSPATVAPLVDGTATVGGSLLYARQDHVHPTDTSRYAASNPAGYITAAGAPVQSVAGRTGAVVLGYTDISGLATVAHSGAYGDLSGTPAIVAPATVAPLIDGTAAVGTSLLYSRQDHVHPTDTSRYAASNPSNYQTAAQVTAALGGYAPLVGPTFSGAVSVGGAFSVAGNTTLAGSVNFPYSAGGLSKPATFSNAGLSVTWNYTGSLGEVDFFLGPQGGAPALYIYSLNSSGVVQQAATSPLWKLDGSGNTTQTGQVTAATLATSGNVTVGGSFSAGQTTINGAMTVTGAASVAGSLGVGGNETVGGNLTVTNQINSATFGTSGNATIGGAFSAGATTVNGALNVTGSATVAGSQYIFANLTVTGQVTGATLATSGNVTIGGAFSAGQTTINGAMTVTGAASVAGSLTTGGSLVNGVVSVHSALNAGVYTGQIQSNDLNHQIILRGDLQAGNTSTLTYADIACWQEYGGVWRFRSGITAALVAEINGTQCTFYTNALVQNNATVNGSLSAGNTTVNGALNVTGSETVAGSLQVNGSFSAYQCTINSGATIAGATSLGPTTVNGAFILDSLITSLGGFTGSMYANDTNHQIILRGDLQSGNTSSITGSNGACWNSYAGQWRFRSGGSASLVVELNTTQATFYSGMLVQNNCTVNGALSSGNHLVNGNITITSLPTSDPHTSGLLWRSGNTLMVSTG